MFILQRVQNAQITYTSFVYRSDMYADVRSNYGFTESEFFEFLYMGAISRDHIYLGYYEGEIPEPEAAFSKAVANALSAQRARKAAK